MKEITNDPTSLRRLVVDMALRRRSKVFTSVELSWLYKAIDNSAFTVHGREFVIRADGLPGGDFEVETEECTVLPNLTEYA